MDMGFAPTWLRQVSPLLHMITNHCTWRWRLQMFHCQRYQVKVTGQGHKVSNSVLACNNFIRTKLL